MKINKLYAGIALASTLVLTGCGGDDDSEYVGGGDNSGPIIDNQLNYSVFDPFTEVVNNEYKEAWGKFAYTLSNNGVMETISTVVGSSPTAYQKNRSDDNGIEYYASKNAFAAVPEDSGNKFYKVNFIDSDTFTVKIQSGDAPILSTYDILTLDLTDVGKQPRYAPTGIDTDLSYFPSGFDATFPSGSECYIFLETPAQSYYTFYDYNSGQNITLEEWIADEREDNTLTNLVQEQVGNNNELKAVRYTDEDGDFVAAIEYKGLVYTAYYYQKDVQDKSNTNPEIEEAYCNLYNDVATDFLETQIKATY
jgi:hypothetical protein